LKCSASQLYNWQYDWHGYQEGYVNSRTFQAYIENVGRSIFACLIDSDGCYHYEQFNLHTTCDTLIKVKDKLVLDTLLAPGAQITLKASNAVSYFWYPWSTYQTNTVVMNNDIDCTATLTDALGCNRVERFRLRKICNTSTSVTPRILMDTTTYVGNKLSLLTDPGNLISWQSMEGLSCNNCSNPELLVSGPATYVATITDVYGCIQREAFKVKIVNCDTMVRNKDKVVLDTLITPGSVIKLDASYANSYKWDPVNGLGCNTCKSTTASILKNTSYSVTLTNDYNCQWIERFEITNHCDSSSLNNPKISMDTVSFPSAQLQLNARKAVSYSWIPDKGLTCTHCQNPVNSVNEPMEYVVAKIDSFDCVSKEKFVIRIRNCDTIQSNNPILRLDTTIYYRTEVPFIVSKSYDGYKWNNTDGLSCINCQNPILTVNATSDYVVEISDQWRCSFKELFKVTYIDVSVVIPNVFTPNNDGINDYFEVKGIIPLTSLKIFNDSGDVIYISDNYQNNWDGRDGKGKLVKDGTYWYLLYVPQKGAFKGWIYVKR